MKYEKGSFVLVPNKGYLVGLEPYVQAVYMWICHFSNERGVCFPSRSTLATYSGCSIKSVDRAIDKLCEDGTLVKVSRKNGERNLSNVYQIMVLDDGQIPSSSDYQSLGSVSESLGVATEGRTNSNHITQPTEGGTSENGRRATQLPSFGGEGEQTLTKREKVIPTPYSIDAVKDIWKNGEIRLQVLSWFLEKKGLWPKMNNAVKLKAMMARHNNSAVRLAKAEWSLRELNEAYAKCMQNEKMESEWTLETIEKYLTK